MAASSSKVEIMQKLIDAHAEVNAISSDIGPVINCAIISGDKNAVELLINRGAVLSHPLGEDGEMEWLPPLALAALLSDSGMFTNLLEAGAHSLTPEEYHKALYFGCLSGRVEVVNKLLEYEITEEVFQASLEGATEEENWDVIGILLKQPCKLDCTVLFKKACQVAEDQSGLLELCQPHEDVAQEVLDECLFTATDKEKENLVRVLLGFGASANAKGELYVKFTRNNIMDLMVVAC